MEARLDRVVAQLEAMQRQNAELLRELTALRRENEELQAQLQGVSGSSGGALVLAGSASPPVRRAAVHSREEVESEAGLRPSTPTGDDAEMLEPAPMESPAKLLERDPKRVPPPPEPPLDHDE